MGLVCKKKAAHDQFRINIQILNVWKITPKPVLWHFKHLNLPSLLTVLSIAEEFHTWGITMSYLGSGVLEFFFFFNSWVGGITVNQSDSQFQHYCFTQGVSVSIIPAGMRIQLQRKVNLDMFIQTQLLYLKQCISALTLKITRKHASHQRLQQTKCDISNSIWGKERFVSRLHEHPKPYSIQELVKCFFNKCCFSEFNAKIILYN